MVGLLRFFKDAQTTRAPGCPSRQATQYRVCRLDPALNPQISQSFSCAAFLLHYRLRRWRRDSQVVRLGSAKAPFVGSIPTPASKSNCLSSKDQWGVRSAMDTKTDTNFTTPSELGVTGLYSPTTR